MRVFFDTNVLVSAFVARGLCSDLYEIVVTEHHLVIGAPVLEEFQRILNDKLHVSSATTSRVRSELHQFEQAPASATPNLTFEPDPADAIALACALASEADVFVTGDKAILALHKLENMPIRSPRELWLELAGFGNGDYRGHRR